MSVQARSKRRLFSFVILIAMDAGAGAEPKAVWIDTDPSVQRGGHEVDDGFALIQAFRSRELGVRGVSVVFGNAPLEKAFPIAEEILKRYGPPGVPLYSGAGEAADLGHETEASRALAVALQKERLTILAIGPLTNVATVFLRAIQ